jgi:hypothetical protein
MKLLIEIEMDNAAFADNGPGQEVARIIAEYAATCNNSGMVRRHTFRDLNGNRVGFAKVVKS